MIFKKSEFLKSQTFSINRRNICKTRGWFLGSDKVLERNNREFCGAEKQYFVQPLFIFKTKSNLVQNRKHNPSLHHTNFPLNQTTHHIQRWSKTSQKQLLCCYSSPSSKHQKHYSTVQLSSSSPEQLPEDSQGYHIIWKSI